jgi:hypothetical protein
MTEQEAIEIINKEFPARTENFKRIWSEARKGKFDQKQALKILINTPEMLAPVPFLMFVYDTGLADVISYSEYADVMRKKALKNKNHALLRAANAALAIAENKQF